MYYGAIIIIYSSSNILRDTPIGNQRSKNVNKKYELILLMHNFYKNVGEIIASHSMTSLRPILVWFLNLDVDLSQGLHHKTFRDFLLPKECTFCTCT